MGAADTDDFSQWLIARIWHNPKSTDQLWAVIELAGLAVSFPLPRPQQLLRRHPSAHVGREARPLGDRTSIGTALLLALPRLRPAGRRVLPSLLPPLHGQVEQPVAVIHRLDATDRRPVSLKDTGTLSQVTNEVHHAPSASNQESVERVL